MSQKGRLRLDLTREPILIVGAGPVGLTLAWRLSQLGLDVQVFEAENRITDQLRASTFHPPTLDYFDESGITAELVEAGRITPTWQIRMQTSGERAEFDLSVLNEDTAHPYRLQCRHDGIVVDRGAQCLHLEPKDQTLLAHRSSAS